MTRFLGEFNKQMDEEAIGIDEKLYALKKQMQSNKENETTYKQEIEAYKTFSLGGATTTQVHTEEDERHRLAFYEGVRHKVGLLSSRAMDLCESFEEMISEIDRVQKLVILRRHQVVAGNHTPLYASSLDEIQSWFEKLGEVTWSTRLSIEAVQEMNNSVSVYMGNRMQGVYRKITILLQQLVVSGFIVEEQPPQVVKTKSRFAATVRLLAGSLCMEMDNLSVAVTILSESQATALQANPQKPLDEASGEILNNTGNLTLNSRTGRLSCILRDMQLKRINRSEKKGAQSVMDEKFTLLFQSTIQMADMRINFWVMSLPVVVIVHGNQEPRSWATITWDNAFAEIGRVPFHVVDKVNWSHMATALSMKFECETGRGLTSENLVYLGEKALRINVNFDPNDQLISWSTFCKGLLPQRMFTFWEWFYAAMKLTRDHLRGPWAENAIIGFIDKRQAELKLLQCPPGTFLLRFSDSELGGISIAWVENGRVIMLQPFCSKDFQIRSLQDRIKDLSQCVTLYPNIPKDSAFRKYYSKINNTTNGYAIPIMRLTVPSNTGRILNNVDIAQHSSEDQTVTSTEQSMTPGWLSGPGAINDAVWLNGVLFG